MVIEKIVDDLFCEGVRYPPKCSREAMTNYLRLRFGEQVLSKTDERIKYEIHKHCKSMKQNFNENGISYSSLSDNSLYNNQGSSLLTVNNELEEEIHMYFEDLNKNFNENLINHPFLSDMRDLLQKLHSLTINEKSRIKKSLEIDSSFYVAYSNNLDLKPSLGFVFNANFDEIYNLKFRTDEIFSLGTEKGDDFYAGLGFLNHFMEENLQYFSDKVIPIYSESPLKNKKIKTVWRFNLPSRQGLLKDIFDIKFKVLEHGGDAIINCSVGATICDFFLDTFTMMSSRALHHVSGTAVRFVD